MRPFLIFIVFIISCSDQSTKTTSPDITKEKSIFDTTLRSTTGNTSKVSGTNLYVWEVDFENKTKSKNAQLKDEYLNLDSIIKGLNILYPKIQLDKIKISGDTLFTEIRDDYYLGESIGSYGANAYIADAVINLTSVKNINFVKIDFEDGSHISPGTWSKKEFKSYSVRQ
jgi:hypothetical protein